MHRAYTGRLVLSAWLAANAGSSLAKGGDMTCRIEGSGVVSLSVGLLSLGLLIGCSSGPSPQDPSWKLVPITDVGMVVGEWEGVVKKEHATFPEGSVRLMIRPNNTYLVRSKCFHYGCWVRRSRSARRPIGREHRPPHSHVHVVRPSGESHRTCRIDQP